MHLAQWTSCILPFDEASMAQTIQWFFPVFVGFSFIAIFVFAISYVLNSQDAIISNELHRIGKIQEKKCLQCI